MASIYETSLDTPGRLQEETDTIQLRFAKTGPTTGIVTWTIPKNCVTGATATFAGMLITASTSQPPPSESPVNEYIYRGDPSVDPDMHTGDKIGNSLVVGAFYGDVTTTALVVTDLSQNTPYYFQAWSVDQQYRYSSDPARAYEQSMLSPSQGSDLPGSQKIVLKSPSAGSDATGLVAGVTYSFQVHLGSAGTVHTVTVEGSKALTYDDLIAEINRQTAKLESPFTSMYAPNTGAYRVDASGHHLYLWNGSAESEVTCIFSDPDPSLVAVGTLWFKPSAGVLSSWDGSSWVPQSFVIFDSNPMIPGCDTVWITATAAHAWQGAAWCDRPFYHQPTDPRLSDLPACGAYWYDTSRGMLFAWNSTTLTWDTTFAISWPVDPSTPAVGTFWVNDYDPAATTLSQWTGIWNPIPLIVSTTSPAAPAVGAFWYNPQTEVLQERINATTWIVRPAIVWPEDPTNRASCGLWWNTSTNVLSVWDTVSSSWKQVVAFHQTAVDPQTCPSIAIGSIWKDTSTGHVFAWDGVAWQQLTAGVNLIEASFNPASPPVGAVWYEGDTGIWRTWNGTSWVSTQVFAQEQDPTAITTGTFWFDTGAGQLFQRNGLAWMPVMFSSSSLAPQLGQLWFDTSTDTLKLWSRVRGSDQWVVVPSIVYATLGTDGTMMLMTRDVGCNAVVWVEPSTDSLFKPMGATPDTIFAGADAVKQIPTYAQMGIGTDGTSDERKYLMHVIRLQLGGGVVDVELTEAHYNICIDNALQTLRKRSSLPYKRGFFFFDVMPGQQRYVLTNACVGYNKIVDVTRIHRLTSAFLSTAHGAGVYAQIILQHLYNFGTFDLLSYELMGQYVNQLEVMFASRVVFNWSEPTRELLMHHRFTLPERVMIDCVVERTEQDLFSDRLASNWIQKFALAQSMQILAQIRGKYASLPGAGGGVSLNASDLNAQATEQMTALLLQIEEYLVDDPNMAGSESTIMFG